MKDQSSTIYLVNHDQAIIQKKEMCFFSKREIYHFFIFEVVTLIIDLFNLILI